MKTIKIFTISILVTLSMNLSAQLKVLANGSTRGGLTGGALRLETTYRYIDLGCKYSNGDHSHFYTNSDKGYWFDKPITINGGELYSFTGDLKLGVRETVYLTIYATEPNYNRPLPLSSLPYRLYLNGNALAGKWIEESDSTLKKEIVKIDPELAKNIYLVEGKKYKFKDRSFESTVSDTISLEGEKKEGEDAKEEKGNYGFIAQEVKNIYPDLVFENEDGKMGIHYTGFIPLIIEALKAQQAEIEELKNLVKDYKLKSTTVTSESITDETLKSEAVLYQNVPNPFTENTEIKYFLAEEVKFATLYIYNMQGNQVKSISLYNRGEAIETIDGSELQPGMYIYALIADGKEVGSKRMILTD